jgi:hypothetical protein
MEDIIFEELPQYLQQFPSIKFNNNPFNVFGGEEFRRIHTTPTTLLYFKND